MPRKARIDAPSALHHIISRGIERGKIFKDDLDRNNFLERFGAIVLETDTRCYAWALIPNPFAIKDWQSSDRNCNETTLNRLCGIL